MILQLKTAAIAPAYFRGKFGVESSSGSPPAFDSLSDDGHLAAIDGDRIAPDARRGCCRSTRCSRASSSRSTRGFGTRDAGSPLCARRDPHDPRRGGSYPACCHPLDIAYTRAGLEPPTATPIAPDEIPHPYRSLLVHHEHMTRRRSSAHHRLARGAAARMATFTIGSWYYRRDAAGPRRTGPAGRVGDRPAEAVVRCRAGARRDPAASGVPLGAILRTDGVDSAIKPRWFFAVFAEPRRSMRSVFGTRERQAALRPAHRSTARRQGHRRNRRGVAARLRHRIRS